jgi:putative lipoprotein (rSAM/lipoprotein system)
MKRNVIRKIVGGLSLTSAMFVFQACYGTPQDFGQDFLVEGQVKSKTSGLPIKGIKVIVANNMQYELTDEEGKFSLYTEKIERLTLQFQDIDANQNGLYNEKDTVLTPLGEKVYLNIDLEEK